MTCFWNTEGLTFRIQHSGSLRFQEFHFWAEFGSLVPDCPSLRLSLFSKIQYESLLMCTCSTTSPQQSDIIYFWIKLQTYPLDIQHIFHNFRPYSFPILKGQKPVKLHNLLVSYGAFANLQYFEKLLPKLFKIQENQTKRFVGFEKTSESSEYARVLPIFLYLCT